MPYLKGCLICLHYTAKKGNSSRGPANVSGQILHSSHLYIYGGTQGKDKEIKETKKGINFTCLNISDSTTLLWTV